MSFADEADTRLTNQLSRSSAALGDVLTSLGSIQNLLLDVQDRADQLKIDTPPELKGSDPDEDALKELVKESKKQLDIVEEDTKELLKAEAIDPRDLIRSIIDGVSKSFSFENEQKETDTLREKLLTGNARSTDKAVEVINADRELNELKRRDAEISVLSVDASRGFFRPSGTAAARIMAIRQETARNSLNVMSDKLLEQARVNAELRLQDILIKYKDAERVANAYAEFNRRLAAAIANLVSEYDQESEISKLRRQIDSSTGLIKVFDRVTGAINDIASSAASSYSFELDKEKIARVKQELEALLYRTKIETMLPQRRAIAASLAGTTASLGSVANSLLRTLSVSGSFTERGFA